MGILYMPFPSSSSKETQNASDSQLETEIGLRVYPLIGDVLRGCQRSTIVMLWKVLFHVIDEQIQIGMSYSIHLYILHLTFINVGA